MTPEQTFDVAAADIVRRARADGLKIPCKRGCSNCCYDIAIVSQREMPPIIERLRRMSQDELDIVARGIDTWYARARQFGVNVFTSEPDARDYFRAHLACPLLDQTTGDCRIYEDRPIACRGHYVANMTPDQCAVRPFLGAHEVLNMKEPVEAYYRAIMRPNGAPAPKNVSTAMLPAMLNNIFRRLIGWKNRTTEDWLAELEK
jgi:Fe-S-cluster containining protein